jgi:hypothetical protein
MPFQNQTINVDKYPHYTTYNSKEQDSLRFYNEPPDISDNFSSPTSIEAIQGLAYINSNTHLHQVQNDVMKGNINLVNNLMTDENITSSYLQGSHAKKKMS